MSAILDVRGVNRTFGAVVAAADISVAVDEGAIVGLIGSNGAGKTTFVNMVTGYLKPDSGSIAFAGRDITAFTPRRITRLGVARSFQVPQLFDSLTVRENLVAAVGVARRHRVHGEGTAPHEVMHVLERFGLAMDADKAARVLPEGVRKLLDIAMALVSRPRILLLDEPTSGVSAQEKFAIMDVVMDAVRADGVTVLFVEHDMDIIGRYAGRVLAFYDGRIIADGEPRQVLRGEQVKKYVIGEDYVSVAH